MSETPAPRIFLSYRRDDSQGFAGRIYDRMAAHFGAGAVFRDINDIEPGRPWEEAIDEAIDYCDVFVLLIGGEWLDASDDQGSRRLEDPEDRHRREIETAVGREIRIFVALMEDAEMPSRRQLPAESSGLREVPALHAVRIADYAFDYGMEQLVGSIERAVRQARESVVERGPAAVPAGEAPPADEVEPTREAEPAVPVGPTPEVEEPARRPRERTGGGRRPVVLAALALGAVAVIVIIALVALSGGGGNEGTPVATVSVGKHPLGIALGRGEVWVTDRDADAVSLIMVNGDTQEVDGNHRVGERPDGVAVDGDTVWVANHGSGSVSRLVSDDGYKDHQITVGEGPGGIAVNLADHSAWVANGGEDTVSRLTPDGTVERTVDVGDEPYGVTIGDDGTIWVTNRGSNSVSPIRPGSSAADEEIPVGHNPKGIDATPQAVWVANTDDGTVSRIDPANVDAPAKEFEVGDEPRGVFATSGSVWVSLGAESQVARLDIGSGEVEDFDVGDEPEGIVAGPSSIWVANGGGTVSRITP